MVAERLLEGRIPNHIDVAEKLLEADLFNSRRIAEISAEEVARRAGIDIELAKQIRDWAIEAEKINTHGGRIVNGTLHTGGSAFVGRGVNTAGGRIVPRDDR